MSDELVNGISVRYRDVDRGTSKMTFQISVENQWKYITRDSQKVR